uniref:Type II inositol-1,4,5-trisphosphate 5-phosphatase n=1 Tax=Magallana gigas TaxID=29159 RepID=K1PPR7_MAGGI
MRTLSYCVLGRVIEDNIQADRYIAIVQKQADTALFLFSSRGIPCSSEGDLSVEDVIKINEDFHLRQTEQVVDLYIGKKNLRVLLQDALSAKSLIGWIQKAQNPNAPSWSLPCNLLTELPQGAPQGLPSSFAWTDKYRHSQSGCLFAANPHHQDNPFLHDTFNPGSTDNPFQEDVFDPLKYMNISDGQKRVVATDNVPSFYYGDEDNTNGGVPDSLKLITNQLGIPGSGVELVNNLKPTTMREHVVKHYMRQREEEFTYKKHYTFQELDLSNQAYVFSDSRKEEQWKNAVRKSLPVKGKYRKVKLIRMVGIMMLVYVKESLVPDVPPSLVDADTVATGIMGIMGNKGGVGVRMTLHNTSLCFINTHLAAHQEEYERRNQDYRDVESKMRFKNFAPPLTISEHDQVFWIGDLNYRINGLDIDKVKTMIDKMKYPDLLCYDQLHQQLGRSDVFKGYKEGVIGFRPTYKYDTGTNEWDSSFGTLRVPYSDQFVHPSIFLYIFPSEIACPEHIFSPFAIIFTHRVSIIKFQFKDVMFIEKKAEILTVCNIGQVPVEFEFINKLEEQSYCQPWLKITPFKSVITPGSSCEIRLEVLVDKSCVATLDASNHVLDDILVLHLTGGKDFFVSFCFYFKRITVNGNFIPSSFGCSLEALVQMHGPIRETPTAQLIEIEQPGSLMSRDLTQGGRLYAVPKEVWRLVDHIWHYGRDEEELFQQRGLKNELAAIRDCLDTGVPDKIRILGNMTYSYKFDFLSRSLAGSVHSVTEALLLFLECLPDPVIPSRVYYRSLECSGNYMLCKQVISEIPEHHKNLFRYLCAFLRELLNHSDKNKLDISILASIFGEIFLRPPPNTLIRSLSTPAGKAKAMEEEMKRTAFVTHFLSNEFDE